MSESADMANDSEAAANPAAHSAPNIPIETLIDTWFVDHFNRIPIGWDAAMSAHVRAAVDDLKARLKTP